jgi:3-carboxy-cis,cis-muconate cycloisomerase
MKLSSSASETRAATGLFDSILARGDVPPTVADPAWLQAMLQVEAALAEVQAFSGVIPSEAADEIAAVARPERFDLAELGARAAESGNPVVPLVASLRAAVSPATAPSVHHGATSQDILDTAAMLVASRALGPLLADLTACGDATARLARQHRDTPILGRTLLQQAVPTTFGLKAAGWLVALDEVRARLAQVRRERLAVQFGGAAGNLAPLGEAGPEVVEGLATLLGLAEPVLPWHTDRVRVADLAGALGATAGVIAKVARDVTLLAQNEVGEVSDSAPGGSSAMAHKRNPVAAICAAGCAAAAPGLVADLLAAMAHEHERAAGGWHAEWRPLRELLIATGSAASWLRACLERLTVHPDVMRANLATSGITASGPDAAGALVDRALRIHGKGP